MSPAEVSVAEPTPPGLARRLRPLQVGVALQNFMLWVAVEKLLLSEIGFTAVSIGVMAAAYSIVVPLLEVPSGSSPSGAAATGCSCWQASRSRSAPCSGA